MSGTEITVTPLGPSRFGVHVTEGDTTTSHEVEITDSFREDLAPVLSDVDDELRSRLTG